MYKSIIFLAVFLLSSCATAPKTYYSLEQTSPAVALDISKSFDALYLRVLSVPVQYDRPQIVILDKQTEPAVHVLNDSLWVSPLIDLIESSLGDDVANYLGLPQVSFLSDDFKVRQINVRISKFDMILNQGALMQASWEDKAAGNAVLCKADLQTKDQISNQVGLLVGQQKLLLRTLASLITQKDQIDNSSLPQSVVSYSIGCT